MPERTGVIRGRLAPCPDAPRCVTSDAENPDRRVPPFRIDGDPDDAWAAAVEAVAALPRTRIVERTSDYLHAECRSAVFRFVDDLELHLRPAEGVIAVRSASRVGYYDFGVNRRRVANLRASLRRAGALR